jgi:hypothetical protein
MAQLQTLHTDRYGDLHVVMTFHEGPRPIHLLENGAYVIDGGLAITDKKELQKGVPHEFLPAALEWLEKKDDMTGLVVRAIKVLANNKLVFEDDGSPVINIEDIINFYEPGPFRTAALEAFAENLAKEKAAKLAMPLGAKKKETDATEQRRAQMKKINAEKKAKAARPPAPAPKQEAAAAE